LVVVSSSSEVIRGALALDPTSFRALSDHPGLALQVVLAAGFSREIAQGFILFINRVSPLRFLLTLLVQTLLFSIGFLVWAGVTWLVTHGLFRNPVTLATLARALGLAYAPQLFSFLGVLPYLGVPLLTLLSLWSAVAFVVGIHAVTGLGIWSCFTALVGGWLVTQLLERTAGQPVMALGQQLLDRAAGVTVITDWPQLQELLRTGRR
jgi:hypothetical protein